MFKVPGMVLVFLTKCSFAALRRSPGLGAACTFVLLKNNRHRKRQIVESPELVLREPEGSIRRVMHRLQCFKHATKGHRARNGQAIV